jgi:hypothetical protein
MIPGESLGAFLLKDKLVRKLSSRDFQITGAWIGKLLKQISEVQKKVDRIHFKSLGGILALQETLIHQCLTPPMPLAQASVPQPPPLPKAK